ncbi:hypothetical protein MG293_019279 [Ovis ammon polii]|uniref:Uncharacterized protein n=1 Tax=Ovis ammon polii TaxID=230172 RepID=A0AAD4TRP9_OVIAM|nr:hypothetical protein MG293_019279 [Ovis ammon polii]
MQGLSGPAVTLVDHEYNTEVSRKQLSGPIFSKQKNGVRNLNSIDPSKITNTLPGKKMNSETSESRVEGGQMSFFCVPAFDDKIGLLLDATKVQFYAFVITFDSVVYLEIILVRKKRTLLASFLLSCFKEARIKLPSVLSCWGAEFVCRPRNAHVQAHRHVAKFPQTQRLRTRLAFKNMMNKVRDVIEEPENQRAQGDSLPDAVFSERLWLLPGPLHGSSASGPCKAVGDTPGSHGRALCGYSSEPVIPGAGFPQTLREVSSVCTAKMGHGATLLPPPCRRHRGAAGVAAGAFGRSPAPSDWEKMVSVLKGVLTGCDPAVGLFLLYLDESNAPEEVDH